MRNASILLCLPLLAVSADGACAQSLRPVGSTVTVVNLVTAEFNRDTRTLQRGDPVHQNERIEVGRDASSELKLDDDTKLALGPGSHLTLDKFVYDPDKAKGSIVLDLVKGTFRFITGVAEKPTYVINTPSAAITVRGTIFDVYVQSNGVSWLLLHEGAVQVRTARGQCKDLYEPGKLIRIGQNGDVGAPVRWASLQGSDAVSFDAAFPFVAKAPSIDPNPVMTREAILRGALPAVAAPTAGNCEATPRKRETVPDKPRKKSPPRYEERPKYEKIKVRTKNKRKEKKRRADDDSVKKGVGAAIGLGLAIGIGKHRHQGGGYGGSMGGGRGMGGYGGGGRGR